MYHARQPTKAVQVLLLFPSSCIVRLLTKHIVLEKLILIRKINHLNLEIHIRISKNQKVQIYFIIKG